MQTKNLLQRHMCVYGVGFMQVLVSAFVPTPAAALARTVVENVRVTHGACMNADVPSWMCCAVVDVPCMVPDDLCVLREGAAGLRGGDIKVGRCRCKRM